jgi:uncharacterized protein with ParB-like and HNH nuclease domain
MTNNTDNIVTLSIKELLNSDTNYIIPIYQRNYAWGEPEITQLIQDIIDYTPDSELNSNKNYYLGTLVVDEREVDYRTVFETIDGQQRLTTLSIIVSVIKNNYPGIDVAWFDKLNLDFESRKSSKVTLKAMFYGHFSTMVDYNESIKNGYELAEKILPIKLAENNLSIEKFCHYFFEKVKIIRVPVPEETDLNHYFEIMNNRGEQLEKHEILKSTLLKLIYDTGGSDKNLVLECFNLIWEACSNMEKYLQYGFTTEQRDKLFGKNAWNSLEINDFDELYTRIVPFLKSTQGESEDLTVSEIIAGKKPIKLIPVTDENPDRFNSVINFPNFLLHVLRIQLKKDIALDDKRLLKTFDEEIELVEDKVCFVKVFAFNLFKIKFLFDKFVIKREYIAGTDKWSLKRLKWYEKNKVSYVNSFGEEANEKDNEVNRRILMLLSMFHVSTPTLVYKHWLNAALNYLFSNIEVTPESYCNYLESLASAFMFDRFLAIAPIDYFTIIYTNSGVTKNKFENITFDNLNYGRIVNNLIFNYLDYLLWRKLADKHPIIIKNFEFTFRSSVEHYYPQNPPAGFDKLDEYFLNSFGNLCLISHSKNSRLSNFMPTAKKQNYAQNNIDSIKQFIMMNEYIPENWNAESISDHCSKMIDLLSMQIDSTRKEPIEIEENIIDHSFDKVLANKWLHDLHQANEALLARALMCFGRIDFHVGWANGGEKWNLFQWERIVGTETFKKYLIYIKINNPRNLEEIISNNILNNAELRKDSFRYAFVSRPEIVDYCLEGNYGWLNAGMKIILMQGSRASIYNSCELYTYLLGQFLNKQMKIMTFCYNDRLQISLIEDQGLLRIVDHNTYISVFLEIWNAGDGKMYYEINTNNLHGNTKIIQVLYELGWINNDYENLFYPKRPIFVELEDDIEENIIKIQNEFSNFILSLGHLLKL